MFANLLKKKPVEHSSRLSDFVRNADSAEKKKVYSRVIDRAIASQNAVIELAKTNQTR
ncbi:hypothetical protein GCM10009092_39000 [Bowmanella denitrificans]|uniref:Uncharacterized protein n=1 Tax=Bowmanella denitrificans TaxID=366582 RepID=A0ABN0XRG0_9ALTE